MNRNKEFFELLNDLEKNAPDLSPSVRKAKERRSRAVFFYRPLAGLAACFALFVLLVNVSAPVAKACANVPIVRQLAEAVTFSRSLSDAVENDFVQQVDMVQEDGGVTAKIEYFIVDAKQVNIFYRLESEEYKAMYTMPKALHKDGGKEEPCTLRTPINDVPNEELRLITLDYYDAEVPDSVLLEIVTYQGQKNHQGEEDLIAKFTFLLEFDSKNLAQAIVYPVNETVVLDGQRITVTDIEVYPTHLRVNTVGAAENTAWLKGLDFFIETEKGRFETSAGGIIATGTKEGHYSFRADSFYFYEAKQIRLIITGARWLSKDMEQVKIDLKMGQADELPEGVLLVPMGTGNATSPVMLHVCWDWDESQHMMLSMLYEDAQGKLCDASVGFRNCWEHEGNCWHEWLELKDYPYDNIRVRLTYTHGWKAAEPITITVQ